jgi:hypothetical protein
MGLAWYLFPINDEIKQAAQKLLKKRGVGGYAKLREIVDGKRKYVDVRWWREVNGVAPEQVMAEQEKKFKAKLDAIKAMADPARNPNEHQPRAAEAALAKAQAAGPPKTPHLRSAPGLEEYDRQRQSARARVRPLPSADEMAEMFRARQNRTNAKTRKDGSMRNTATKPRPQSLLNTASPNKPKPSLNTTKPKSATKPKPEPLNTKPKSDRNRDRHRPGYMREYLREYMRRRRAAQRAAQKD